MGAREGFLSAVLIPAEAEQTGQMGLTHPDHYPRHIIPFHSTPLHGPMVPHSHVHLCYLLHCKVSYCNTENQLTLEKADLAKCQSLALLPGRPCLLTV